MEQLSIAGRVVGPGAPPYVIAEIGSNHNGDMELCRRLVDAARDAGADAVKLQSWTRESLISSAEYARNTRYAAERKAPTLEDAVRQYQMTPDRIEEIVRYCEDRGVVCFSSCFARSEVDALEALSAPAYKIASMDVNHLPLLEHVGRTGKPVLLSTGMATLGEVERALGTLRDAGAVAVVLLHCVSLYPCPPEAVHLSMIETWRRAFDVPVGYSDHTLGSAVSVAAAALGACVIEKHFTLDTSMEGWDHALSADPDELRAIVHGAGAAWRALGSGARQIGPDELAKRRAFRRRMVARRPLRSGDAVCAEDVEFKRPGTGIQPDELRYIVGRRVVRDVAADDELEWADFA